ncbi:MAG: phosphoesterase, partial [Desulfurococcales archaeon ex4484_58]
GDIVFIADIALSEAHLGEIESLFKLYSRKGELIYIDHHPEPIGLKPSDLSGNVIHDTCCSASELTYKFFSDYLEWDYSRVALYGAIGDYLDTTPWALETLRNWDKRTIYFEAGVLTQGLEGSRRLYDFKRHVVKHLAENKLPSGLSELLVRALIESMNDEELRSWVREHFNSLNNIGYVGNPPGSLGKAALYARIYSKKPVGIAFQRHKGFYNMSLRAGIDIDLNTILRQITPRLGGTGGGHHRAAGARIPVNKLKDFLEELDMTLENYIK